MLWILTIVHYLHLLAAIVWVGGMIFTAIILAPVARAKFDPSLRSLLFKAVGGRFAVVGRVALAILIISGSYKVFQMYYEGFFFSAYGVGLIIKVFLVSVMIVLSLLHDFVWGVQLEKVDRKQNPQTYQLLLKRLVFWARVNLLLVLAIVFLAAALRMRVF